jgi:mannose/fructose/N-acetylgalactosamine-specific phosphotransferase system component IIC
MQPSTSRAGGCFLTAGILAGMIVGLLTGDAMRGVLIGTGLGIIAAIALWLVDRKRD